MNYYYFEDPSRQAHTAAATDSGAAPVLSESTLWKEYKQVGSVCLGVSAIFILTTLVQVVLALVAENVYPAWREDGTFLLLLSSLTMYAVAMPISLLIFRVGKSTPPAKRRLPILAFIGALALCYALAFVGTLIGTAAHTAFSRLMGREALNPVEEIIRDVPFAVTLLVVGVIGPIMEEIFYRKLVIDRFRRYGDVNAALLSALLFGLIHGNFSQFFYAFFFGVVLGFLYCHTGRLRYTVAIHIIFNSFNVMLSELLTRLGESGEQTVTLISGSVYLLSFVLAPIAAVLLIRKLRPQPPQAVVPGKTRAFVVLLNPALWLMLAVIAVSFLLG